jgi:hypothetical protein
MIAVIDRLKQFLPPDLDRARPYADERLIVNLADIYEKAGGTVSAYRLSSGSSARPDPAASVGLAQGGASRPCGGGDG